MLNEAETTEPTETAETTEASETTLGAADNDSGTTQPESADGVLGGGTEAAADGEKGEAKTDGEDEGKAEDQPEPFDASKIEMPEGFEVDQKMLEVFSPLAEKLNLSQEDGDAMAKIYTDGIQEVFTQVLDKHSSQIATWATEAQGDSEIGGNNWKESLAAGERALATFGTDGLKQVLKESGLANHPEVIRFVSRAGKALSEDSFSAPDAGTGQKKGLETIYDHPTSQS